MSSAIRTNNKHKNDKNINTKDLIIDTGLDILTKKLKGAGIILTNNNNEKFSYTIS